MLADEAPEPLTQGASLSSDVVEFPGRRSRLELIQRVRRNKLSLSQPLQEPIATVEPLNGRIDGCRERVHEIEASESATNIAGGLCTRFTL